MSGPIAPAAWRGALPITYRLGPGPAQVHLKVSFNWDTKPLYDVIATIPGSTFPDEWIVRGNHHDAWVNGAADPVSGMAPELEEARALGQLVKQGWRPKRTIVYAAWDGEEPALLGSTEWVEQHDEELRQKAVVYINSDGNSRGFLQASGSHTLEQFVNDVARSIEDPETKGTVWTALAGAPDFRRPGGPARREPHARPICASARSDPAPTTRRSCSITAPPRSTCRSAGWTTTASIIPSTTTSITSRSSPIPASSTAARSRSSSGRRVIRLADADVLPYEFTGLADTVQTYVRELQDLLKQRQDEVQERNRQIDRRRVRGGERPEAAAADSALEAVPPALNFAPLENAALR